MTAKGSKAARSALDDDDALAAGRAEGSTFSSMEGKVLSAVPEPIGDWFAPRYHVARIVL